MSSHRPSRILITSEYFPPHWTGLSKTAYLFAAELARENSVTVLTTHFDPKLPVLERMQGVRVIRVPYLMRISRSQYSPQTIPAFARLLRDCDHVIINSPNSNVLFLSILAKLFRKKLTIYHHGDFILPKFEKKPLKKFLIERIFDLLTIPSFWLADRVATYTRDYCGHSRVMRHFPSKWVTAIPPLPRPPKATSGPLAKELKVLGAKHTLIGFSGRFVEEKGFDVLLRAIPKVLEKIPDARFVFAGEINVAYEGFFASNRKLIDENQKHLVLLGLLRGDAIWEFYRSLDVFVLSSRSDCFAHTQAEAALCGVPLVVSDIPGARVLVTETKFGELVRPEDPTALAEGIVKVARQRVKYLRHRDNVDEFLRLHQKLEAA